MTYRTSIFCGLELWTRISICHYSTLEKILEKRGCGKCEHKMQEVGKMKKSQYLLRAESSCYFSVLEIRLVANWKGWGDWFGLFTGKVAWDFWATES